MGDGQVVYTMETETAKHLISRMMGGYEIQVLDEIAGAHSKSSAIGSSAATELYILGIGVNITHPTVISDNIRGEQK